MWETTHVNDDVLRQAPLFNGLDDDHVAVRYFGWDAWISDLAIGSDTHSDLKT